MTIDALEGRIMITYRGHKEGRSRFVKNYESEAPIKMANNVISRVRSSVT